MKITWFTGMTFRLHISGRIVVSNPEGAPETVDAGELVSGADSVVGADGGDIALFDPDVWRPRRRTRLIDEMDAPGAEGLRFYRLGNAGLVCDSLDEGMLVLDDAGGEAEWGRWADGATIVLSGSGAQCAAHGAALLDIARPRLIALAVADDDIDTAFDTLVPHLGDAGLMVLDAGLAVEV